MGVVDTGQGRSAVVLLLSSLPSFLTACGQEAKEIKVSDILKTSKQGALIQALLGRNWYTYVYFA